ncbi:MAG TPA: polysaccharide deacetylase family protein [Candidatus Binatia bacterium]|nr:polysaccharide deacetylase family protein [Candidatus Binatia bacterium]
MRLILVVVLLLTAALILASFAMAEPLPANELGRIMILEYHKIDYPEGRWTRTPENFRKDLETLYARGYRLQSLNALIEGRVTVPAGTTPVVLTFDDSSPGQFRYVDRDGAPEIDPKSAVGVLEAFIKAKPDFGRAATFFVLPAADPPNRFFNQPEHVTRKLRWLVDNGYELGNHTLWHANLGKYDETVVRAQLADAQAWVQKHVPDYKLRTLALPHGIYPKQVGWALTGTAKGTTYQHEGILMVSGGAAPSPFAAKFNPLRVPRIQALERDLKEWLTHFDKTPEDRFVSDGDPSTVTITSTQHALLRPNLPKSLKVIER